MAVGGQTKAGRCAGEGAARARAEGVLDAAGLAPVCEPERADRRTPVGHGDADVAVVAHPPVAALGQLTGRERAAGVHGLHRDEVARVGHRGGQELLVEAADEG